MIKVKLAQPNLIKVRLLPPQGINVDLKTTYLYDPDWIPAINNAITDAYNYAEIAKESSESAEASANSAAESARNADADADNASESAGLAAQEAQKAIDAATTATQEADAAAESAYQSQQSALAAYEYAQNASSDAENALESLEHVLASVAEAKTSELNAKESETKAKASETKATQEANASAESAYQSQQSALAAYEYASNADADAQNVNETLELVLESEQTCRASASTSNANAIMAENMKNQATQQANRAAQQANIATEKADESSQFALECQEIKNSLGSVYKFKGSVNTFDDLPTAGNEVGDVYNIIDTDKNYAWDGEKWDDIGGTGDLSDYALKTEIPTKTSELENDSGFITAEDVPEPDLTGYLKNSSKNSYGVAIGSVSAAASATDNYTVAVGAYATASKRYATSIGGSSGATGQFSTAIGYAARAQGQYSIQVGQGGNANANTMNVGLSATLNVRLLNADGTIPAERLVNVPQLDLTPYATTEYVDTTEQGIIQNFMDADTALQTQITGLSGVLTEEQNKIEAIEGKIPTNASSSNLLSTASDLLNATQDVRADFAEADSELQTQINGQATAIAGKIDYSDKPEISGWGMPSGNYIDLTLGATGTSYTAPVNGWFYFGKRATVANQFVDMYNQTSKYRFQTIAPINGVYCLQTIPARKGDVVQINYDLAGAINGFYFIYAEGEN